MREIHVSNLTASDIYASVGTAIEQLDPRTGDVTPIVTDLSSAHGLLFVPDGSGASGGPGAYANLDQSLAALSAMAPQTQG